MKVDEVFLKDLEKRSTTISKLKVPKQLATCADDLYTTRTLRLRVQRMAELLNAYEGQLRDKIIAELPKSESTGISGKVANAKIETKAIPVVKDRAALQAYIKKTGRFDLLQNRLSDSAVQAMWEDNKQVPGVESMTVVKVSCTKVS